MQFNDRVSIERVRKLDDGRVAAVARFARSGVYSYAGREVGRPDLPTVNVYRADDEVFSEDAMASFTHKAITIDHPTEPVNAANWRKVAVGYTEGRVARDGGFVEVPLMLADAEAVSAVESGRMKELSAGYSCQLVWGDGIAPDGQAYQARQVGIRGNHVALVAAGRAGPDCRVGDSVAAANYTMDQRRALAAARYQEDAYQASKASLNAWRDGGDAAPVESEADAYDRSVANLNGWRDATTVATLRHARYQG